MLTFLVLVSLWKKLVGIFIFLLIKELLLVICFILLDLLITYGLYSIIVRYF